MFGEKYQAWADKNAGTLDRLGAIGVGLSQASAGQPVNIMGAWDAIQKNRTERDLGKSMRDPSILAGFTPQQQTMLSKMPPQMAQQLIMERVFAPPPKPEAPNYREFGGDLYNMNGDTPTVVLDGFSPDELAANKASADKVRLGQEAEFLGYTPDSREYKAHVMGVKLPDAAPRPMTPEDKAAWGIPTSDAKPYALVDGKPMSIGGGGITVNNSMGGENNPGLGKLSTDFAYIIDPATNLPKVDTNGMYMSAPIPGSPAAIEAEILSQKAARKDRTGKLALGTTLESINLNLADIKDGGLPVTGIVGDFRRTAVGRTITGNGAVDFGNRSSQITDSAALAEIQNMRDNSPTGGAVGALTDGERVALGNARTAINASTSDKEYSRAAEAYRKLALDIAYGEGAWQINSDGQVFGKSFDPANAAKSAVPEGVPTYNPATGQWE